MAGDSVCVKPKTQPVNTENVNVAGMFKSSAIESGSDPADKKKGGMYELTIEVLLLTVCL